MDSLGTIWLFFCCCWFNCAENTFYLIAFESTSTSLFLLKSTVYINFWCIHNLTNILWNSLHLPLLLTFLFLVSFYIRINLLIIKVLSTDNDVIVLNNTSWQVIPHGTIPFLKHFHCLNKPKYLLTATNFDLRKYLYSFIAFSFSLFVLYLSHYSDLSNPWLKNFASLWLPFTDKVTTGLYNFLSLILKIIFLELASAFLTPVAAKTHCFVHLSFNLTFQLTNGISRELPKLVR